MSTTRFYHTATPLADGRVLVAGGYDGSQFLASAEVYDPTTNLWSPGGILGSPRSEHTATPLAGGRVLVAGGYGGTVLAKAEVYDPATNSWSPAGTMGSPRLQHTATALADGRVLVVGGNGSIGSGTSAEVYDPSTNSWSPVSGMACSHTYHAATRLTDGRVLVAGGSSESPYAEVYDPATNLWSPTGTMGSPRYFRPTASALTDGRVLVAGGYDGGSLASAEVYDPATNLWSPAGTMGSPRFSHTATSFGDDRVLIVGGYGGSGPVASAEIYDPAANLWTTFGTMSSARYGHTATALANGRILVAGGQSGGADLASVEIFQLQVDHPPVAVVIAPTRTVEAAPGGGIVTLDARGSSDPDGDSLSYNWTSPGFTLPSGPFIEYPFPVGTWSITLTVTDPFGLSSSQVFTVTVVDTLPPSISNVPNSIIVDQTSALGAVVTFPWPTAEDNYDPLVIVHGSSDPAGVVPNTSTSSTPFLFPVGTTTVFFSAADQSGNPSDVAQMTVTVRPNAATPSQIYVNSAATGENFGSSWTDAFTNLQSALAVAPAGSEIWVAAGTYVPGTQRSDSFHLKPQVNLYGGFAGTEATREQRDWLSNITTLDGQVGPSVSSYHVVIGADNAALDGFTVVNGLADGAGTDGQGGGMLNLGVSPTVLNCVFTSNSARAGGAIYNDSNSSLISRCTFRGNIGSGSAALDEGGGAMYNRSTSLTLRNCTFINNQTGVSSGGALFNVSGAPTLTNCVFQGNRATSHGGAIANVWLTTATNNCTFVGNRCGGDGGAVADTNCPGMTYLNCIFWKNVAGAPSNQLSLFGADCTISFCDIQGGLFGPGVRLTGGEALTDGGGNLDANPQFADPSGASQDGLRLWLGSPCIDRGSPIGAPSDDLLGRSRPQGMGVDIGAYEWVPSGPGRRLYVKADATGANTGLSWADAFTNLQPALIAASAGDEIWVARGFYVPGTSRSDSFQLKSWVNVYGGFSGTETVREQRDWLNNVTTLTGRINSSLSSYHVVKGADDALLDAFLVRDGNADGPGDDGFGGGVLNLGVSPTLRHCWIMVNTARGGAGVYNRDNSPSFSYCWFYFNFAHGTSYWEEGGGGLANSNARVTLKGCLFGDCRALDNFTSGGGIWQMQGSLDATNCAFFRNTSSYVGGGLASYSSSVSLMNCTFTRNQSGSAGGALLNWPSSATITNSIFWDDLAGGASEILLQGTPATVAFCDVQGGIGGPGVQVTDGAMVNDGGGTFSQDPYFADVTGSLFGSAVVSMSLQDGLRLKAGSPCINAGTAVGAPPDDLLGVQRPQGTGIDIGAYENPMEALTVLIHYPTTEPSYTTASTRMTLGGDAFSWPYSTGTLTYSLSGATSGSGTIPFSRNWVSSPITFNPGTTEVTVNLVGPTGTSIDHVTINVVSAPAITSPLSISGIRGQAFNYQILATGFPLPAIQVGPLPPGLSFDPGTGMIVGTPDTWGSYDVPLSASNSYGTDSKILRIDIANLPPTADIVGPTFIQAGSTVTFLGSGSIDPFHDPLTYSWDLSGIPLGTTPDITFIVLPPNVLGFQPLTLTVTNPAGLASTRTLLVDIEDTEPPALTAPALIRVEQTERNGAWVDLQCQAIDAFEGPVDVIVESTEPPGAIPPGTVVRGPFLIQLGTWIVHVMAGDSTGHQTRAQITVTVEDTTPPVLTVAPEERTFNDSNSFYSVVQVRRTVDFGSGDDGAPLAPGGGDQFYGATGLSVGGIRFTDSWGYLYARGSGDPLLYGSLSYSSSSFSTLRASLPRGVTAFGTLIRPFNAAPSAVVRITLSNGQVFQESGFLFNQWRFFGASSVTPIQWIDFELMADPIAGYDFNTLLFDNFSVGLGPNTWEAGDPPRLAPVQASDLCDANPMVNTDLSVITGVGTFTLVYTATDASHNTSLPVPVRVTVVDTTPPVFGANPGPFTIPQTSLNGTPFNVPLPAITDAGDPSPKVVSDAPAKFPLGTTSVTITATDASGNSSSMIITVTVVAALPPQLVFTFDPATDTDGDGIPDIIDPDIDGDGIPNSIDNAPFVWNPDQSDLDGDGVGDVIDPDPAFAGIHTVVHLFTIRVERNRSEGADHVTLPPVSAFEGLGGNPTLTNNAPLIFPLGPTLVRYTAVGSAGLTAYGIGIVIVVDTIPPDTTLSGPPPATSSTSATFTFSSSESNCTFQRKLDGGAWVPAVSPETISGLANGSHVYRVRAIDSAGNVDPTPASLSWIVDTSAPQKGSAVVNDGPGADLDAQTSTTIQANWSGFADPQSGIALYEWAIGTKSGGADIQPFLSVGTNTSAINNSLTVAPGIRYFVTVRATNGAGIQTTKSSDGVWVVTGPPPAGTVRDGAGADIDVQASNTMIQANWTAFTDAQSGPVTYEWAIGTVAGGEDVQPFTSTGTTRNGTNSILSLVSGVRYYVTVRATNLVAMRTLASSDGVVVDTSPPALGTVNDGGTAGVDIDTQTSKTTIKANWTLSDPESGIKKLEWAIGTSPGASDIMAFKSIGTSTTSASKAGLTLVSGSWYYVTIRATNGVGDVVTGSSNGVKVQ